MLRWHLGLIAVLVVLGLAGCVCGGGPARSDISQLGVPAFQGSSWTLIELEGTKIPQGTERVPYIQFNDDEEFVGMAGCNRMFGKYWVDAASISFSDIGTTKMFCPAGMDIEGKMLEVLDSAAQFKLVADTLELLDDSSGQLARFVAAGLE